MFSIGGGKVSDVVFEERAAGAGSHRHVHPLRSPHLYVILPAAAVAALALGLSQPPLVGVACPGPNLTTCGRIGIAVWLKKPAAGVTAVLRGHRVRLHAGGLGGPGPTYWEGYAHLTRRQLRLPRQWFGTKPIRSLLLRLTIAYPSGALTGVVRLQLRPGWG